MDSLFYDLLARLVTLIAANANIISKGATVQIGREAPVPDDELPFIGVYMTGDASIGEFGQQNTNFLDWDVNVAIEISLSGDATVSTQELEQEMLNLRADVHEAIMTDAPTLSLTFVLMAYPLGANEPNRSHDGKKKTASYRTEWGFRVRTTLTDMTTV